MDLEAALRQRLEREPRVVCAYLFGSVARGTDTPASDVDLAILHQKPPVGYLEQPFDLEAELSELVGRSVQIVVLETAPSDLVHRVLCDGKILVDRDPSRRIAVESERPRFVTDAELVAKRLALIETYLTELRQLARPDQIELDVRERRFIEHTLQLAIQAALDVASHIVSDERLGEPRTNQELFGLLASAGVISAELGDALRRAVGFRNVLVHGYASVDVAVVRDVVEHHLGDLDAFVAVVRARL